MKIFLKFFSIISFLFVTFFASGQSVQSQIKKAEKYAQNLAYINALEVYNGILNKKNQFIPEEIYKVKLNLADTYFKLKQNKSAEKYYGEIFEGKVDWNENELKSLERFAQVLSVNGKYQESAAIWKKYNSLQNTDKRGLEFAKLYNNLDPLMRNRNSYKVEYVGLNTSYPDFSPTYYKNGLVFVSSRNENRGIRRVFSWDNSPFLDLYLLENLSELTPVKYNPSISSASGQMAAIGQMIRETEPPKNFRTPNDVNTLNGNKDYLLYDGAKLVEKSTVEVKPFSKTINSKYHEGPSTFFKDANKIIFTRNASVGTERLFNKNDLVRLQLFIAEKKGNEWRNIKSLPFNSLEYSTGHPALNESNDILYFVSDMPGGFGGTDIYMSRYNNGMWTKPENLGALVNSNGNEMFPYLDSKNGLYFSSDGFAGLGGLDMFFIEIDSKTGKPQGFARNLGAPLNSSNDDFGIVTDSLRSKGYFSSNRKRGGADDDIYMFIRTGEISACKDVVIRVMNGKEPLDQFKFSYKSKNTNTENAMTDANGMIKLCLAPDENYTFSFEKEGFHTQQIDFSAKNIRDFEPGFLMVDMMEKKPEKEIVKPEIKTVDPTYEMVLVNKNKKANNFEGHILSGQNNEPIAGVNVKFINNCNQEVQEIITGEDGKYDFERDGNCDYTLVAFNELYGRSTETIKKDAKKSIFSKKTKSVVKSNNNPNANLLDTKMFKVGDVIKLDNIYYGSESFGLSDIAKKELNKVVSMLNRYPNMVIEVASHTDTRGNALNNLRLSQLRANEVDKYLAAKGIPSNRVRAIGKGEMEPLNACADGVNCTEAEHQRNRRTEIKVLTIERK